MNKTLKTVIAILAVLSFSSLVFAQEPVAETVAYSFSGFGGGLPSSATQTTPDKCSSTSASAQAGYSLSSIIVGGVLIATGIVVVAVLTKQTNGECYTTALTECSNSFLDSCAQDLGDACAESIVQATCGEEIFLFF